MESNPTKTGEARQESPRQTRVEELTAAQRLFARGLMRVSGTNSVEAARVADWRFDGRYDVRQRDPGSTNYKVITETVIPKEGEAITTREKVGDTAERRCTICHQPIIYVNLIGVNGQIVQTGSDCSAKLLRFKQTGEIVAENPRKEMWKEQSEILLKSAGYERDVLQKLGEKRISRRKIIASMMSWLVDHVEDESMPEDIKYAVRTYNNIGMLPSDEAAQDISVYYKSARRFLPGEVLKDQDIEGLKHHPHRVWLKKIVGRGIAQENIHQLERIIQKGRESEDRRFLDWYKKRDPQQWRKTVVHKLKEERSKELAKGEGKRGESTDMLYKLESEGVVNRHNFSLINFAADVCLAKTIEGKKGLARSFEGDRETPRFYEIGDGDVVYLYELDQQPVYGYGDKAKWFVVVGEDEPEQIKLYPRSVVRQVAESIKEKEIPWEAEPVSRKAEELAPEATIVRFSCAQVVISNVTNEPVVLLGDGPMPLVRFLEEYQEKSVV